MNLFHTLMPGMDPNQFHQLLDRMNSIWDFQHYLMLPVLQTIILPTFSELTVSGLENLDRNKACLFISNHRDIVLDSAVLNYFLHINNFPTAEIAIGDNLLKESWIRDLVRLNKSFVVKRSLDNMEMLRASKKLSAYIKDTIVKRNESVWIAQRAGRAKDGNDETNRGLITMFGLSADGDSIGHFRQLNIVPVSVSYQYDPCDGKKTREIYLEKSEGNYVKSEKEDVESMKMGITLPKGKGHIHFGKSIGDSISKIDSSGKKSQINAAIAELIDEQIQSNYKLWSSNYIAGEMLIGKKDGIYSDSEKSDFENRVKGIVTEIHGQNDIVRDILLGMYNQPLVNSGKWKKPV